MRHRSAALLTVATLAITACTSSEPSSRPDGSRPAPPPTAADDPGDPIPVVLPPSAPASLALSGDVDSRLAGILAAFTASHLPAADGTVSGPTFLAHLVAEQNLGQHQLRRG